MHQGRAADTRDVGPSNSILKRSLVGIVALIGIADYLTGPDVGLSLFYLAPIVWSAWNLTRAASLILVVLSATFWLGAELAWRGVNPVSLWNGFTRLGIYLAMAWLASRLRVEQQQLRKVNAKLQTLLEQEKSLARTDALTNLANRRLFVDELKRATARSHRLNTPMTVAYVDLDAFKPFNDRHGHLAGDTVLQSVADVLRTHVGGNGVAARLGSDDFVVLLEQCTETEVHKILNRLFQDLTAIVSNVTNDTVGVNVGIACFDRPPLSPDSVIDHADAAMFCAKARGRNSVYETHIVGERVAAEDGSR